MPGSRSMRPVEAALRCYPQRWRSRHGDEAGEIARLLIQDGTPAWSVAWSYLLGAARMRLVTGPRRRLGAAVSALLLAAASLGVPLALLSATAPANAASMVHTRAASQRRADQWHGNARRAGARSGEGGSAPERCGRLDLC